MQTTAVVCARFLFSLHRFRENERNGRVFEQDLSPSLASRGCDSFLFSQLSPNMPGPTWRQSDRLRGLLTPFG